MYHTMYYNKWDVEYSDVLFCIVTYDNSTFHLVIMHSDIGD